ncbi:MAG: hypothetical protein L3J04_07745 [Robiginitomaculum sp.]|nr:hypothetical protein [Robiginitomaculum sp.]
MANWKYFTDMEGKSRPINTDLVWTVSRDGNKTVISSIGDHVFLTLESVEDVMKRVSTNEE